MKNTPRTFTPAELHSLGRRLDRRVASIHVALAAMRQGDFLHLEFRAGRARWLLSCGRPVSADVGKILTQHASVRPVGGALLSQLPGQEWRFQK
jgi:hypothetical protein